MNSALTAEILEHNLRIFGLRSNASTGRRANPRLKIVSHVGARDTEALRHAASTGMCCIVIRPDAEFCSAFDVMPEKRNASPASLVYRDGRNHPWARLRTLHSFVTYAGDVGETAVEDTSGRAVWRWVPVGSGGMLFVGTDLAEDLVRYRQGDPAKTETTSEGEREAWDFPGERPVYLFVDQLAGEDPYERHADWWARAFTEQVALRLSAQLSPMLPDDAPGAVVVTGDDDSANLECYAEQLRLMNETPITYFLLPKTRHSQDTVRSMLGRPWIDLGIHPDALEAPQDYAGILAQQVSWFDGFVDRRPISLRNHGFLNDGYWRQLPSWRRHGIRFSSNLPGFDGRVLNGSLVPTRLVYEDELTEHWSVLTVIGDGVVFAQGMNGVQAGDLVWSVADRIRASELPGVMVLNLHPENVANTAPMHEAVLEVIREGFHAWTMRECLEWYEAMDHGTAVDPVERGPRRGGALSWLRRFWPGHDGRSRA